MNGEENNKIDSIRKKYGLPLHYYGDTVRRLFVASAIIMIATLPFFSERLPVSSFFSILVIVVISISAGFLAPRNRWVVYFDLAVSAVAVAVFEYYAVETYKAYSVTDVLFLVNQTLAVIFLFALYNSAKTLRSL